MRLVVANCQRKRRRILEGRRIQPSNEFWSSSLGTALSGVFQTGVVVDPLVTRHVPSSRPVGSAADMQEFRRPTIPICLAEVFPPEAIVIGLQQHTKAGVVAELVHRLVENERIAASVEQSLIELILAREKMGSTALGNGLAFPNCRSSVTESFVGALGIDSDGVPFDALDKSLVHSVFLLIGPLTSRAEHFDILGRITSIGRHKAVRLQLIGCGSAENVNRTLQELDRDNVAIAEKMEECDSTTHSPYGSKRSSVHNKGFPPHAF